MKKALIVFAVIIAVVAVLAGAAYFSGWFSSSAGTGSVSTPKPVAAQPAPTTTAPATTPAGQPTATAGATSAPATTTTAPFVKFDFVIGDISGSGFTRTVTAEVSNLGNEDAHHVTGEVQVTQGGSVVKINGEPSLTVQIGTLPAGTTVTVQQDIKFGLLDGLKIQNNGAEFTITLRSDEATATFSQFYQP
jgi:hypothetical protein